MQAMQSCGFTEYEPLSSGRNAMQCSNWGGGGLQAHRVAAVTNDNKKVLPKNSMGYPIDCNDGSETSHRVISSCRDTLLRQYESSRFSYLHVC